MIESNYLKMNMPENTDNLDVEKAVTENLAKIDAFISTLYNRMYPVGRIIMDDNPTNPANREDIGFGTWIRWGKGRVPVGIDEANSLFNTVEKTGGTADAIVPYHNHTFTGSEMETHTHTFTGSALATHTHSVSFAHTHTTPATTTASQNTSTTPSGGGHGHFPNANAVTRKSGKQSLNQSSGGSYDYETQSQASGAHTHTFAHTHTCPATTTNSQNTSSSISGATSGGTPSGSNSSVSAGKPSGSISYAGTTGNGINANLQPYITCYMWKRTV